MNGMRLAEGRLSKVLEYAAPSVHTLVFLTMRICTKSRCDHEERGVAHCVASLKNSDI